MSCHLVKELSPLYFSKEKCTLMLEYLLYELLDSTAPECTNEHVDRMLKYIDEHIHEKLTLQIMSKEMTLHAVASHLGYDNYNYFCRIFKNRFGMTPGQARKET